MKYYEMKLAAAMNLTFCLFDEITIERLYQEVGNRERIGSHKNLYMYKKN